MKLRYEIVNGGGRLVDEENKVYFTEKDLDTFLMHPILPDWRKWEVEQLAIKQYPTIHNKEFKSDATANVLTKLCRSAFIEGYNHNKAKYTEEDLIKFGQICIRQFEIFRNHDSNFSEKIFNEVKQSLQKIPKYIVMESKIELLPNEDGIPNCFEIEIPKLVINSEGRQEGIIKEIIYE